MAKEPSDSGLPVVRSRPLVPVGDTPPLHPRPINDDAAANPSQSLAPWQRTGLAGGGTALVVAAIFGHLAAPLAATCVVVGGALYVVGFGFNRAIKSVIAGKSGFGVQAEEATVAASIARDANDLAHRRLSLVREWSEQLQEVMFRVHHRTSSAAEIDRLVAEFVRSRLADLTQELKGSDAKVRASLWLLDENVNELAFAFGNEIENPNKRFRPGEGLIGRAFSENRIWNVPDGPRRPEYVNRNEEEPFHGLLCIPLVEGTTVPLGVLCIDRTNLESFPTSSVDLVMTLGQLFVLALSLVRAARADEGEN